jgi:hypothetical protein
MCSSRLIRLEVRTKSAKHAGQSIQHEESEKRKAALRHGGEAALNSGESEAHSLRRG